MSVIRAAEQPLMPAITVAQLGRSVEANPAMRSILLCLVSLLLGACFPSLAGDTHTEIVKRSSSPDGSAEVVVELVSGGATVSSAFVIYLAPKGVSFTRERDRDKYRMGSFDRPNTGIAGVEVVWQSDVSVVILADQLRGIYRNKDAQTLHGERYLVEWRQNTQSRTMR